MKSRKEQIEIIGETISIMKDLLERYPGHPDNDNLIGKIKELEKKLERLKRPGKINDLLFFQMKKKKSIFKSYVKTYKTFF